MSDIARCPACGALAGFRRSRSRGFWEKSLTRFMGLRSYRCDNCGRRFRHHRLPDELLVIENPDADVRAREPFVADSDTDDFSELIRRIAATEHRDPGDGPSTS